MHEPDKHIVKIRTKLVTANVLFNRENRFGARAFCLQGFWTFAR